jgi:predicted transcriptional regulator
VSNAVQQVPVNHLREIREARKLSRMQLSLLTQINPSDLCKLEKGLVYPYPGWRKRLSNALGESEKILFPGV